MANFEALYHQESVGRYSLPPESVIIDRINPGICSIVYRQIGIPLFTSVLDFRGIISMIQRDGFPWTISNTVLNHAEGDYLTLDNYS